MAAADRVWDFVIDPTRLGPCSPVPIERVDDRHYRAQARLGSGFFSATVKVDLEVTDVVDARSVRIVGRGGASGTTVEGSLSVELRPGANDGTTILAWEVEVRLAGMFAGQAARLIEEHGPVAMERLLTCIHREVEP